MKDIKDFLLILFLGFFCSSWIWVFAFMSIAEERGTSYKICQGRVCYPGTAIVKKEDGCVELVGYKRNGVEHETNIEFCGDYSIRELNKKDG